MLSIQIREVADYPPENVVETSAKPCCCCCCCCNTTANASDRDDPLEIHSSLELADFAEINRVIEDQGVEDEHGYKGRKPPKMADNVNYIHFHERMIRIRSEYDMYADFLGTHAYSRAPWTSASQVVRAKSKVDAVARRLDEQMTRLDMEVAKFSYSVSHNTWFDWYSGVDDMTAYSVEDMSEAFGVEWTMEMSNTHHHHFVTHLQDTLPATINSTRPLDEKQCQVYIRKLLILLNAIASTRVFNDAMHFAILLKTKLLRRPNNRWFCADHLSQQNLLSYSVWNLIRLGRAEQDVKFWDFARAWRELWIDWQTWDLFERTHVCALKHRSLMVLIYKFAAGEVQSSCRLALQARRLPAELALLITEHTMLASGVPLIKPDRLG